MDDKEILLDVLKRFLTTLYLELSIIDVGLDASAVEKKRVEVMLLKRHIAELELGETK